MSDEIQQRIDSIVKKYPIIVFMKGTPDNPQCGFSSRVAMILKDHGKPFASFDVLSDPAMREGVKQYAQWPTIPQLYIGGEFIGGSDIIGDMYAKDELQPLLDAASNH